LLKRLIASGVIERRTPGGHVILRFNLDPAAEYLAAVRRVVDMKTKRAHHEEWQRYFSSLERTEGYPSDPEANPLRRRLCARPPDRRCLLRERVADRGVEGDLTPPVGALDPQPDHTALERRIDAVAEITLFVCHDGRLRSVDWDSTLSQA
jgi:hypothetical protein